MILNHVLIIFYFLVLACFSTRALGTTNEVMDALPPAAAGESHDKAGVQLRDPFWPIGYVPPSNPEMAGAAAKINNADFVNETQVSGSSEMLKIGGVVRSGGKFYATINGFTVQTGEVVTVFAAGEVYKFLVEMIDLKKVRVKPLK